MFSPYAGSVSMPVLHDNLYALVLFGLLLSSIGILLYFNGLAKVDPHKGSIISLLEPVCAIVFSYFVLHEALTNKIIIGCALILAGAFIAVKEKTDYGIPEDDLV
jgi:drug/metabolite transporter (DMT)-like permease